MKKFAIVALIMLSACGVFAGTVFGTLEFTAPTTDTGFVIVFHDFSSLYDTMLFFTEVYPPSYEWVISDPLIIDDFDYYALAIVPSGLMPILGDPAGQYPGNPFRLSGGNIADITIPLDTIGTVFGTITGYDGQPDSLVLGLYNYYPFLIGLPPTLAFTYRLDDTVFSIENVPAGPFTVRAWVDLNGNGHFDSSAAYIEPFAWHENDMGDIIAVGGGSFEPTDIHLPWTGVSETQPLPERLAVHSFPNPFNSTATFIVVGEGANYSGAVYDIAGRKVADLFEGAYLGGITALMWSPPEDLESGTYLVRIVGPNKSAERQITYIK
ncbi:MAG TPA: T9SS type A sorting domain-containing protein [candidate division Zixibacteria bacterium]|nr:T9SS type A sorting domain-containing protein [candidate division Zixibacteria bacterium]